MRSLILMLACASLAPSAALAQTHREVIAAQLEEASRIFAADGFRPSGGLMADDTINGMLPAGGSVMFEVNLRAGRSYVVMGACDSDCTDLDARVYGPANNELDEDVEMDDIPMLAFQAGSSGPHLIEVAMPGCSTANCYFGVRIFND